MRRVPWYRLRFPYRQGLRLVTLNCGDVQVQGRGGLGPAGGTGGLNGHQRHPQGSTDSQEAPAGIRGKSS